MIKSLAISVLALTHIYLFAPLLILSALFGKSNLGLFVLMLCSVSSNLVGLYTPYNYAVFVIVFFIMVIKYRRHIKLVKQPLKLVVFVSLLQLYGLIVTIYYLDGSLGENIIETLVSALFSIIFPIAGLTIASLCAYFTNIENKTVETLFYFIAGVVLVKLIFGPLSFLPPEQFISFEGKRQLTDISGGVMLRIFGPTLGPNALGLILYFIMLWF